MDNMQGDIPRLRIVHIISGDRWAGAEVQAYTLLSELAKMHDVFAIVLNPGYLTEKLAQQGLPVKIFDESKLSSLQILLRIRKTLNAIKPDVIHTHRQKENILGSIANWLSTNARCVRTTHGAPEFKAQGKQKLQVWLDQFCGNYLQNSIICVSEDLRKKLLPYYKAKKLHVVYNGINPESLSINALPPQFKSDFPDHVHIGIVGRLEPVKRVDIFLETASRLHKICNQKEFKFHIYGDGSLESALRQQCANLNLNSQVIFHGHCNDIHTHIKYLDYVLMCSDHEGLPMTALESLALGTPILAHDVGGLSVLLEQQPYWLTKEHSPEGYLNLLLSALKNREAAVLPKQFYIESTLRQTVMQYLPETGMNHQ